MKKLFFTMFTMLFSALLYCTANADTIINVPVDSRPISDEYVANLVDIGRDEYISMDKADMDFFSSYEPDNHLGNSKNIREKLIPLVQQNNNENTTVIINTSTYVTNGLVGSRAYVNYNDYKTAMEDLYKLVSQNTNPRFYINMAMPRTLPETRFNTIWPDSNKVNGLAYYYLERNPEAEDYSYISSTYAKVTPEQLLMEYSYVYGKATELGGISRLTDWEKDFLNYFNSNYKTKAPYKVYVDNYTSTFECCADMFKTLAAYKKQGLIDEIVVSNDDLQVPNSITYFFNNGADWVQSNNGSAIKYSIARLNLKVLPTSVEKTIANVFGNEEVSLANTGRGKSVNIINGTDEVTQLIYARDYSKRKNITPKYNITTNKVNKSVAAYDVVRAGEIAHSDINFASGNVGIYTQKPVDLYIYDYVPEGNDDYIFAQIQKSISKNNYTSLIELFGTGSVNKGNYVFQKLLSSDLLSRLTSYSAWNTNGNAIGLGIAQAQVFAVADNKSNSPSNTAAAQAKMLLQHIIEDGVYTCTEKRTLSNQGYRPNVEERTNSDMLWSMLDTEKYVNAVKKHTISVKGQDYVIDKLDVNRISFPWGRIFDIYIDSDAAAKPAN